MQGSGSATAQMWNGGAKRLFHLRKGRAVGVKQDFPGVQECRSCRRSGGAESKPLQKTERVDGI